MSGSETVSVYSLDIFRRANVKMNNYILAILINSGFTLGYMISAMIMTSVGRKLQFISSGLFMAVSLATLGFTLDAEVFQIQIFFKPLEKILNFSSSHLMMTVGKTWLTPCCPSV